MNYRPKRPSELVAAMTEQYEEREPDVFGRAVRGGPGKKKGKAFFHVSSEYVYLGEKHVNELDQGTSNLVWSCVRRR